MHPLVAERTFIMPETSTPGKQKSRQPDNTLQQGHSNALRNSSVSALFQSSRGKDRRGEDASTWIMERGKKMHYVISKVDAKEISPVVHPKHPENHSPPHSNFLSRASWKTTPSHPPRNINTGRLRSSAAPRSPGLSVGIFMEETGDATSIATPDDLSHVESDFGQSPLSKIVFAGKSRYIDVPSIPGSSRSASPGILDPRTLPGKTSLTLKPQRRSETRYGTPVFGQMVEPVRYYLQPSPSVLSSRQASIKIMKH